MDIAYAITVEETPSRADTRFVVERLGEFNHAHTGVDADHRPLAIFLRDESNEIVGGLLGGTYWGWLHVDILWVKESLRYQGYGQALLAAAEQEAMARGCHHAHLDTMSFQALPFYEKHGYTIFGELRNLPAGNSRYFLQKPLQPDALPEGDGK